jgi:3-hydroxyisobutyrate dehydrogenase-like beta-hydroxyacid dehydrogenase
LESARASGATSKEDPPDMNIAFIGLGVMGFPMAGHLQRNGHAVTVWNRSTDKAARWQHTHGGRVAGTPAEAAATAELVMTCVGNDADVRAVSLGSDGIVGALRPGALLIDHTTASAQLARELDAACRARGAGFLDAPVSGGQPGAENGQLTIMCGGSDGDFARAAPVLRAYAKSCVLMGPAGNGQLTKMVNQICVAGVLAGLAEGMSFAEHAGLDLQRVIDVISKGAAQSWQMDNRHRTMIADQYNHGFAVDWMRKDLAICLAEAAHNGSDLTLTRLIDGWYADVQAMGGGRWDTSALFARLRRPHDDGTA